MSDGEKHGYAKVRELDIQSHLAELLLWGERFFNTRGFLNPSEVLARDCMLAGALRPCFVAIRCRLTINRVFETVADRLEREYEETGVDLFVIDGGKRGSGRAKCSTCGKPELRTIDDRFVCFFCLEKNANEYDRKVTRGD
jgi:hypothetical protein